MDTNTAYLLTILQKNDDHRKSFFHLPHLTSELVAGLWQVNIKKWKDIGSAKLNCLYAHNWRTTQQICKKHNIGKRGAQIFVISRSNPKRVTWSKLSKWELQILRATVQNSVTQVTWHSSVLYPCTRILLRVVNTY